MTMKAIIRCSLIATALFVGCQTVKIAKTSRALSSMESARSYDSITPPKYLYHFGAYSSLIKSVHKQIPKPVWDNAVMARGGGYRVVPYRRGYYGCSNPHWCSSFTERQGEKPEPWLIRLTIKNSCLIPSAVAIPSKIIASQEFIRKAGANSCSESELTLVGGDESHCDQAMNRYLEENSIKLVFDEAMPDFEDRNQSFAFPNSWYIRDRNCVEKITGSPAEILSAMTKANFWLPVSEEQWFVQDVFLNIIKTALRHSPELKDHLPMIRTALLEASKNDSTFEDDLKHFVENLAHLFPPQ